MKDLFTASEALAELERRGVHIARGTLRSYVEKGSIAGIVRGHATFVSKADLEGFKPMAREDAGRIGAKAKWDKQRQQTAEDLAPIVGEIPERRNGDSIMPVEKPSQNSAEIPTTSIVDLVKKILTRGRGRPKKGEPSPEEIWESAKARLEDISGVVHQKRGRGRPSREYEAILEEYNALMSVFDEQEQRKKAPRGARTAGVLPESFRPERGEPTQKTKTDHAKVR